MPNLARLVDDAGDAVRQTIRAYHGSPHNFDRFDASKIGTGEGVQAYGHGLYFAGDNAVANSYRRKLTEQPGSGIVLYYDDAGNRLPTDLTYQLEDDRRLWGWSPQEAPDAARGLASTFRRKAEDMRASGRAGYEPQWWEQAAQTLEQYADRGIRPAGRTYEVELGVPETALLDYDRPFSTPAGVAGAKVLRRHNPAALSQSSLRAIQDGSWRMESFAGRSPYQTAAVELTRLAKTRGGAEALMEAGIPGVRYLDGNSRGVGAGTRNYVMFPGTEDKIRILSKYAVPPLIAAGMQGEDR